MKHLKLYENINEERDEIFTPETLFLKAFQRFAKMNFNSGGVGTSGYLDGNSFNAVGFDFSVNSEDRETELFNVHIYLDNDEPSYVGHGNFGVRNNKENDNKKRFITSRDTITPEQTEFLKQIYKKL